ncbi:sensor histidine kinase [Acetobacter sp.]|jgi:two-component system phosphate regulon sensor histidine kinase PhoR|uniref:sensor histidine kinase n=1 Tax=Acetobacter sp. TaxID=440 RepID=UPI0025C3DE21|nr:ATP-binding protein [Acetobacter sp.]MCH4091684.1 ATP-binding protein [Acetobacter sp.]MCI1300898.1 ATP-binding protein [Acetobacter sp.]MCI1316225.1 ATP-binding protein [Acetobacter sp.]
MTAAGIAACLLPVWLMGGLAGWFLRGRSLSRVLPGSLRARREEVGTASVSLEEVLDLLPQAAVLLDGHGAPRFANIEAREAFGDALGTIMRYPDVFSSMRHLNGVTVQSSTEFVLTVPVRRVVRVDLRLLPELLAIGPAHILAILTDCSDRDAVERMRSDFVAYASHELRTPLTALIGFIETLRGPAADDPVAQQQFLTIMATQAHRMQRLIEQLLELSRVEMLEHRKPRGVMNARQVVELVRDELGSLCAARHVELDADAADVMVPGDQEQIIRVLVNLIENAVKYAGADGRAVRIQLSVAQKVLRGLPGVAFVVEDNGVGIAEEHLPRLTERFYRVEGHRNASGYGLGLAIVRHIVDRHDGHLDIASRIGHGTRCEVWLPCVREAVHRPSLQAG